jgi:hypothetical protein
MLGVSVCVDAFLCRDVSPFVVGDSNMGRCPIELYCILRIFQLQKLFVSMK